MSDAYDDRRVDAFVAVSEEINRAQSLYPPMHSAEEGISVIREEFEELWDWVKIKPKDRDINHMRDEATQLAAMAIRFMIDVCK